MLRQHQGAQVAVPDRFAIEPFALEVGVYKIPRVEFRSRELLHSLSSFMALAVLSKFDSMDQSVQSGDEEPLGLLWGADQGCIRHVTHFPSLHDFAGAFDDVGVPPRGLAGNMAVAALVRREQQRLR